MRNKKKSEVWKFATLILFGILIGSWFSPIRQSLAQVFDVKAPVKVTEYGERPIGPLKAVVGEITPATLDGSVCVWIHCFQDVAHGGASDTKKWSVFVKIPAKDAYNKKVIKAALLAKLSENPVPTATPDSL